MKLLAEASPELFAQLDPEKNDAAMMERVTSKDKRKFWWIGQCGHSWESQVANRVALGVGCPYCAGQKVLAGFNDLATHYPDLASQWHPSKNGELTAQDVNKSSAKKIWWQCESGHDWQAPVNRRTNGGAGCPACAGKSVVLGSNDLATTHPELAAQWHADKNNKLSSSDIVAGSTAKVWWRCTKGHDWQARVKDRAGRGSECPFCSRRAVLAGFNDLGTTHPDLAAQWHPTKNEKSPQEFLSGSGKKAWWKCDHGHEWEATLLSRASNGNGCPGCAGLMVIPGVNDLLSQCPDVAAMWHPSKNGNRTPRQTAVSSAKKVWWQCPEGHEWEAIVSNRSQRGRGCPVCSNQKIVAGVNDLAALRPDLAEQWDQEKNGILLPSDVGVGTAKKVWWKCASGHPSWQSPVRGRVDRGYGCSYCVNRKVMAGENDLATVNPVLASLWHPTKNGEMDATMIPPRTPRKFWWQCTKGHEWETSPQNMSQSEGRAGCPQCGAETYVSGPEHDIAEHFRSLGLEVRQTVRNLVKRTEFDIYLPQLKTAIEFNGLFWHSEAFKVDDYHKVKLEKARAAGITLFQVWEDDWRRNPDLALLMIKRELGLAPVETDPVEVVPVTPEMARDFLLRNSLQGFAPADVYLGVRLISDQSLVAVATAVRHPNHELEINRYAVSQLRADSFEKLISWIEWVISPDRMTITTDNSFTEGGTISEEGFVVEEELEPDFQYLVRGVRVDPADYTMDRFRDDPKLQWEEDASIEDLAKLNKLHRVYDAGKVRWVKVID